MASLRAHLRQPDEHSRLAFHPQCPQCCSERLAGELPAASLSSRRVQAGITAGVLALTSVAPTAAFAADGTPGTAPPDHILGEIEPGEDPAETWQEGEEAIEGEEPIEESPPPASVPDDIANPAPEGSPDASIPAPEVVAEAVAPAAPEEPAPPAEQPAPVAAAPVQTPPAPVDATADPAESAAESVPKTNGARKKHSDKQVKRTKRRIVVASPPRAPRPATAPVASIAPAPTAPAVAPARRVVAVAASSAPARAARPGDESHVVERGESLWSIAADLVGDDASPARIAREVNRLWELNKSRIGTGDRNLLMAGTRLEL